MAINYGSIGAKKAVASEPEEAPVKAAVIPTEEEKPRQTITNWRALAQAGLKPTYIRCDTAQEYGYNAGCHSVCLLDPAHLAAHMDNGHGGGFFISFREGYMLDPLGASTVRTGRHWDGWLKFEELGLELLDFRCEICDKEIKVNAKDILKHLKRHGGKQRIARPGGDFWIVVGREAPETDEDEI